MRRKRGWRSGEWLVRDEESGFLEYGSNVKRDAYGVLKRKDQCDKIHPQSFVKAGNDPYIQYPQADPSYVYDVTSYEVSAFVFGTNIPTPQGPASHLFYLGIGSMQIGSTFKVR